MFKAHFISEGIPQHCREITVNSVTMTVVLRAMTYDKHEYQQLLNASVGTIFTGPDLDILI